MATPGGNRSLVGNITVKYVSEGLREAMNTSSQYQTLLEKIADTGRSFDGAFSSQTMSKNLNAAEVGAQRAFGSYQKFTDAVIGSGGDLDKMTNIQKTLFKQTRKQIDDVLKAQLEYAKENEGRPLFGKKHIEDLLKYDKALTTHEQQFLKYKQLKKDLTESEKDYAEGLKDVGILLGVAEGAVSGVIGSITGGVGAVTGFFGNLLKGVEESDRALKSFSAGFSKFKAIFSKGANTLKSGAKLAGGMIKDKLVDSFSKKNAAQLANFFKSGGSAAARAGPLMSEAGAAIAGMGPAIAAVGAALIIIIPLVIAAAAVIGTLTVAVQLAMDGFATVTKIQEEFRLSTYRSLGSVSEMTAMMSQLGAETKLGTEDMVKAAKAMHEAGFSGESLGKSYTSLTGEMVTGHAAFKETTALVGEFARSTGIGEGEIAKFQKTVLEMTGDIGAVKESMGRMIAIQRLTGATTDDMAKSMGHVTKMQAKFKLFLDKTDVAKFSQDLTVMYGKARQAGIDVAVVTDYLNMMNNAMSDSTMGIVALGGSMEEYMNTADASKRMEILQNSVKEVYQQFKNESPLIREQIMKDMGITENQILLAKRELGELTKQQMDSMDKQSAMEEANKAFGESVNTLTQSLKMLFAPLLAMAAEAIQPFQEGITDVIQNLQTDAMPLFTELKGLISDIFGKETFEAGGGLRDVIKMVIGAMTWLVQVTRDVVQGVKYLAGNWDDLLLMFVKSIPIIGPVVSLIEKAYQAFKWFQDGEVEDVEQAQSKITKAVETAYGERAQIAERAAEKSVQEQAGEAEPVMDALGRVIIGTISDDGSKSAEAFKSYYGSKMDQWASASARSGIAGINDPASMMAALAGAEATETAKAGTIPTVKTTSAAKAGVERDKEIIALMRDQNDMLAALLEKEDPNTEAIANILSEKPKGVPSIRSGLPGGRPNQWGTGIT